MSLGVTVVKARISKLLKGQEEAYLPSQKVLFSTQPDGSGADGESNERDVSIGG